VEAEVEVLGGVLGGSGDLSVGGGAEGGMSRSRHLEFEIRRLSAADDDIAIEFLRWTSVDSYGLLQISGQHWSCFEVESTMEIIKIREFSVLFELV
jgi:hypothetical protein